ncbi:MAG: DNA cytosine methyltransferase [Bacteroidales bacterium]|nr:DNA cytosine methyltransferase [Bacteroidales bacterium]
MRIVDLFCGCGGMSLGFQLAGHKIAVGMDCWDNALAVYKENFSHPALKVDLSKVDKSIDLIEIYQPDMIIGGPPCQDFSSAGKRNENNGRGDLTVDFANIVASIKPQWFVMENVARILKTQKLTEAREIFHQAGYGLTQTILDASLCGVPQARKRFILIGCLDNQDDFMSLYLTKNLAKKPMTIADYMGEEINFEYYYRHPRSYARRGIFSIYEPSPTIRGVNRPIPDGYPIHPGDPIKSTIGIRPLTTKERSRIQTFPKDFKFIGNKTDTEQMIGNAVPVNLGRFVGNCINNYLIDHPEYQPLKKCILDSDIKNEIETIYQPWKELNGQIAYCLFESESEYHPIKPIDNQNI